MTTGKKALIPPMEGSEVVVTRTDVKTGNPRLTERSATARVTFAKFSDRTQLITLLAKDTAREADDIVVIGEARRSGTSTAAIGRN